MWRKKKIVFGRIGKNKNGLARAKNENTCFERVKNKIEIAEFTEQNDNCQINKSESQMNNDEILLYLSENVTMREKDDELYAEKNDEPRSKNHSHTPNGDRYDKEEIQENNQSN